jgi:hypothetical protein
VSSATNTPDGVEGGPHRATGESASHVLDTMVSAPSIGSGRFVGVASTFAPSPALSEGRDPKAATLG